MCVFALTNRIQRSGFFVLRSVAICGLADSQCVKIRETFFFILINVLHVNTSPCRRILFWPHKQANLNNLEPDLQIPELDLQILDPYCTLSSGADFQPVTSQCEAELPMTRFLQ